MAAYSGGTKSPYDEPPGYPDHRRQAWLVQGAAVRGWNGVPIAIECARPAKRREQVAPRPILPRLRSGVLAMTQNLGRGDHGRRAQRPGVRRLPRRRRPRRSRARASRARRRRHGDRGGLSRVPLQRVLVRRQPAAPAHHQRPRSTAPRLRAAAARRHAHADARRRLPDALARRRRHAARARAPLRDRRRALRALQPAHVPPRARGARPARHRAAARPRAARGQPARAARAGARAASPSRSHRRARQAHDHELRRFPRALVLDAGAARHALGERHHRHLPRPALAGLGLRDAASLHGRDRRPAARLGPAARRHERSGGGDRGRGAGARRHHPHLRLGARDPGGEGRRQRRGPRRR